MEEWQQDLEAEVKDKEDTKAEAKDKAQESPTDKEEEEDLEVENVEGIKKGREKYYGIQ